MSANQPPSDSRALVELAEKWRAKAGDLRHDYAPSARLQGQAFGLDECADDLLAALACQPPHEQQNGEKVTRGVGQPDPTAPLPQGTVAPSSPAGAGTASAANVGSGATKRIAPTPVTRCRATTGVISE